MRVYLLVMLTAAAVTFLMTPLVRRAALRLGAITPVRDRDVHVVPIPRLGGIAMFIGLAVALLIGSQVPFLEAAFEESGTILGVVIGAGLICLLGAADDVWDLDWMTKLVGQVLAAGIMAWFGVQLITFPVFGLTIGSSRLSLVATVLVIVVAANAVNFVDGLDGLAAGTVAIGGGAFFVYAYLLTRAASPGDYSDIATAVIAALVGACVGFLPHNFHPARIFMGDSGAYFLGLTVAAAAIIVTGRIDPATISGQQALPAYVPILLPVAVLLLPLLDVTLAVIRRVSKGHSPFHPDRMHLHHRLLDLGHSQRRATVIMYLWTAVFSFSAVALAIWDPIPVGIGAGLAAAAAAVVTWTQLPGLRGRPVPVSAPEPVTAVAEPGAPEIHEADDTAIDVPKEPKP